MGAGALNLVTAVVCCREPYRAQHEGLDVVVHQSIVRSPADFQAARWAGVRKVRTPFFFFLDDDDDLPADYLRVLDLCVAADVPLAYTDEIVTTEDGTRRVSAARPYSQAAHIERPLLMHHLALCKTAPAQKAIDRLPLGHYYPEMMLYWELAKGGAAYIPEVGYVWHKRPGGMHNLASSAIAQMRTQLWARADFVRK